MHIKNISFFIFLLHSILLLITSSLVIFYIPYIIFFSDIFLFLHFSYTAFSSLSFYSSIYSSALVCFSVFFPLSFLIFFNLFPHFFFNLSSTFSNYFIRAFFYGLVFIFFCPFNCFYAHPFSFASLCSSFISLISLPYLFNQFSFIFKFP